MAAIYNKKIQHSNEHLVYNRRSTDDTDNQKNSIDYQRSQSLVFAQRENLTIADYNLEGFCKNGIIEERHTAFKTPFITINKKGKIECEIERPKFQILVRELLKKKFAGVICLCWDRISRNDQDGLIIKDLIRQGVDVRFVETQYDRSSSGELHMDIDNTFSKHYSRVIRERVKNTFKKRCY